MATTRPKVDRRDPVFTLRLPVEERDVLTRLADVDGRSRSALVREAIRRYLDERDEELDELTSTAA